MLTVDTATVTGTVGLDKTVKVIAKDERGKNATQSGGLESASDGTAKVKVGVWKDVKKDKSALQLFYTNEECSQKVNSLTTDNTVVYFREKPAYQMDIVPYVTGVKTSLSSLNNNNPSVYNRTALGHYSINSTESVYIYGFNLYDGELYDKYNTHLKLIENTEPILYDEYYRINGSKCYKIDVKDLKSGEITIKVNNIPTLNNINKQNAKGNYTEDDYENCYNCMPNGINNNLLEDDVFFDIWEFDSEAAKPLSGQIRQPIMKISPATGMIQFAFANGPLYFSMGGGNYLSDTTSHDYWSASYDMFTSIGFAIDDFGYTYGCAAGGDINANSADLFVLYSSRFGNPGVNRKQDGSMDNLSGLGLEQIAQDGTKSNSGGYVYLKERIKSPSIVSAINNNATNLYMAYFDGINNEIRFKSGSISEKGNTVSFGLFKDDYIEKESNGNIKPKDYNYNINNVNIIKENIASEFISLGVIPSTLANNDSKDVVVIIWYDGNKLNYAYNETPMVTNNSEGNIDKNTIGSWKSSIIPCDSGVGQYCKIVVDKKGGIHIAAYDQMNGDLKYIYRSNYKDGSWIVSTVDSYGIIGSEISLDVAINNEKPIPYISYYADSAVRPKIAYLVPTESNSEYDGAKNDFFTKKWEISYLPTLSTVPKDHINIGLWKNASGEIVESIINGSSGNNCFNNWQNKYGTYPNHSLVTKAGVDQTRDKNNITLPTNTYNGACYGYKFANGSRNPMIAYQVGSGITSTIETAQMK